MSGPLIYIGTYTVKSGKREECKQRPAYSSTWSKPMSHA